MKKIFLILLLFTFFVSCKNKTNGKKENIVIEAIIPLTGNAAVIGKDIKEGIEIATEQKNNLKVIFRDSKNSPKEAVSIVENSFFEEKPDIYISAMSGVTSAIVPLIDKKNKLLFSTVTGKPNITKLGKNIFRFYYTNDIQGKTVVEYAINEKKIKQFNVIYINDDYGVSGKDFVVKYVKQYNGFINNLISIDKNQSDTKTSLIPIIDKDKQATIIIGYGKMLVNVIKRLAEMNNKSTLFTYTGIADPSVLNNLGKSANGVYLSIGDFNPFEPNNDKQKKLFLKIKNKYNKFPSHYHAFGYDLIGIINNYLIDENNRNNLLNLVNKEYEGVLGKVRFGKDREIRLNQKMAIIKNNKIIYIDYE